MVQKFSQRTKNKNKNAGRKLTIITNCRSSLNSRFHQIEDGDLILTFHRLVDVGDVGGVMFVVMDPLKVMITHNKTIRVMANMR